LTPLGWLPECGYCGHPIKKSDGMDLHEALITRGDIHGRKEIAPKIFVRENVSLVHHGKCHVEAATKEGQKRVAKHIAYWVGNDAIMEWLDCLEDDFVGTTITEARNLIKEVTYA
jgi:hypothetical protein